MSGAGAARAERAVCPRREGPKDAAPGTARAQDASPVTHGVLSSRAGRVLIDKHAIGTKLNGFP